MPRQRATRFQHSGDEIDELQVRCIGPSREYGRKRTYHYGVCRCGWQSARRSQASSVTRDYREHVAEDES